MNIKQLVYLLFLNLTLVSCTQNQQQKSKPTTTTVPKTQKHETEWLTDFYRFRQAVLEDDVATLVTFLANPMDSEHNNIWYLAQQGYVPNQTDGDQFVNFTTDDLEAYYETVFPEDLKRVLNEKLSDKITQPHEEAYGKIVFNENRDSLQLETIYNPLENRFEVSVINHSQYTQHKNQKKRDQEAEARGEILGETGEKEDDNTYEFITYGFVIEDQKKIKLSYVLCSND